MGLQIRSGTVRKVVQVLNVIPGVALNESSAPALAQAGLSADRVIYVETGDEKSVLACFEEGLRHGGLGAVVAEISRFNDSLSPTSARRGRLRHDRPRAAALAPAS